MLFIFSVLAIFSVVATVMALFLRKAWWIRVFDFPRLQIIFLQIISMAGIIIFYSISGFNLILIGLTFLSMIIQVSYIYPYFPFTKKRVEDSQGDESVQVSFMVANVLISNRKSHKLIDLVNHYKPEIFLAVETGHWWEKALSPLAEKYNHNLKYIQDNTYGMWLFSNLPLENEKIEFLINDNVPSIHAEVIKDNYRFQLSCVHPKPPSPNEAETSSQRDRELLMLAKNIASKRTPYIVLGDLNDVAWSDTSYKFEKLSKLKDPRRGRGFFNTFHAKVPFFRWALDHVFVSMEFKLIQLKRLPKFGSDHFPIFIKFGIKKLHENNGNE